LAQASRRPGSADRTFFSMGKDLRVVCALVAVCSHLASAEHPQAGCDGQECSKDDRVDGASLLQKLKERQASQQQRLSSGGGAADLDRAMNCKDQEVDCPSFHGCPDSHVCMGVTSNPVLDPDSPYANAGSNLPDEITKSVAGMILGHIPVVGSFFSAAADMFWPGTDPNIAHQTMFDSMNNWVKDFVQEQVSESEVKHLKDTLDGYKTLFHEANQYPPCSTAQVAVMFNLDTQMTAKSTFFQNPNQDWQGMSLFPSFVDLHLTVKAFLFRALQPRTAAGVLNVTSDMLSGPTGYVKTAEQFFKSIIAQRVGSIADLRVVPTSGYSCNVDFIQSKDRWAGCDWSIDEPVEGLLECPNGVEPFPFCFYANCQHLVDDYTQCRNMHVSAVEAHWSDFFSKYLLLPARRWPEMLANMKKDILALNTTFQDCQAADMPPETQLRRHIEQAVAMAKHRYGSAPRTV